MKTSAEARARAFEHGTEVRVPRWIVENISADTEDRYDPVIVAEVRALWPRTSYLGWDVRHVTVTVSPFLEHAMLADAEGRIEDLRWFLRTNDADVESCPEWRAELAELLVFERDILARGTSVGPWYS